MQGDRDCLAADLRRRDGAAERRSAELREQRAVRKVAIVVRL